MSFMNLAVRADNVLTGASGQGEGPEWAAAVVGADGITHSVVGAGCRCLCGGSEATAGTSSSVRDGASSRDRDQLGV